MVSPGSTSAAVLKERLGTDETWLKIHLKLTFPAYFSFVIFIITLRDRKIERKQISLDPHINLHSSRSTILLIPPEYSSKVPDTYAMAIYREIKLMLFYSSVVDRSTSKIDEDKKKM